MRGSTRSRNSFGCLDGQRSPFVYSIAMKQAVALLSLLCLLAPALGCDKASPVAPAGSILSISANPSTIGLTGSSTITIVGRKPDGNPLNPGTEIRLSTDRGTLSPSIVEVDSGGRATATLRGDGRPGAAKVTAATADATVETTIQIGQSAETKPTVLLSVNPSIIPTTGFADITVIARNSDGSPAADQRVILTTNLGQLTNPNPKTGADGRATSRLNAEGQSGTATVTALLGSSDPATTTVDIRGLNLVLQANPASIQRPASGDTREVEIEVNATVTDFEGDPVSGVNVTFQTERGTIRPSGSVETNAQGVASVSVFVTRQDLEDASTFRVTASIPSGSGEPITQTVTITVSGT
jgi:adhesin/invasin